MSAIITNGLAAVVECDGCAREEGLDGGSVEDLRGSLHRLGWTTEGQEDLCAECVEYYTAMDVL